MAEAIKLSSGYYVDPKFEGISANAERLFLRLLAWCGAHETAGSTPRQVLAMVGLSRSYGALSELITRGLVTDNGDLGYTLPGWSKWQSNVDELALRRKSDRERKAVSRGKSRDNPEMSQALGKGREGKGEVSSKAAASSTREEAAATEFTDGTPIPPEPDDDWPALSIVPTAIETGTSPRKPQPSQAARTLVRQVIPGLTREVTDQLANHVAQAARDGTPDAAIRTGLERWRDDPDRPRPGALPYRIGDAARELAAQTSTTPARPSKQRGMAEMLAQARAEEAHQKAAGELE